MSRLGRVITEAVVLHYGRDEFLRRLAHPFWFQSFGAVMGMDWHSSGVTTSVMGALKRGLTPVAHELGIHVCGGRGRHSRQTPDELVRVGERVGIDGGGLAQTSRLVAKVDSAAVQDGFELYLHSFVVTDDGRWAVVQQGMHQQRRHARRYHWLSDGLLSFVDAPHAAIEGPNQGIIVNLTDERARRSRDAQLELLRKGPDSVLAVLGQRGAGPQTTPEPRTAHGPREACVPQVASVPRMVPEPWVAPEPWAARETLPLPYVQMPARHDVRPSDVVLRRLHGALAAAAERGPQDFADLLLTPGLGARTVLALALAAEVIYGAPCRFSDPARFSLALGGKDGHPFPVPIPVYDETIRVLRHAVDAARLSNDDRLAAVRRLDAQARLLERVATGPSFTRFVAEERRRSLRPPEA
jgi:hypothetical protein